MMEMLVVQPHDRCLRSRPQQRLQLSERRWLIAKLQATLPPALRLPTATLSVNAVDLLLPSTARMISIVAVEGGSLLFQRCPWAPAQWTFPWERGMLRSHLPRI
jgi:hypothetical protein